MKKVLLSIALIVGVFVAMTGFALAAWPNGADTVTEVASSSAMGTQSAASAFAQAGNVTELTISGVSVTQSWQGYYGQVSGAIELANAAGNVMYNWSTANPSGEVMASRNDSVDWSTIGCFDMANANIQEALYNIEADDVDGIDETFTGVLSEELIVASKAFTECNVTRLYDNTGVGVFEEALLVDSLDNLVFTSILNPNTMGFNGSTYDFQMLVLEDGHGSDVSATPYFFYVELE